MYVYIYITVAVAYMVKASFRFGNLYLMFYCQKHHI